MGNGYLNLSLYRDGFPIAVYQEDDNGNPIFDDGEILLLQYNTPENPRGNIESSIHLSFHGNYFQFLRTSLLAGTYEDQLDEKGKPRTRLSEEHFYEAKKAINKLIKNVDGRSLEEIAKSTRSVRNTSRSNRNPSQSKKDPFYLYVASKRKQK